MRGKLIAVVALISLLASSAAVAAPPYLGIKFGAMNPDSSNLDPAWNVGATLGWRIPNYDYFSVEGELTTSLLTGDVKSTNDDWTVTNLAGYGVFRAGSPKVMFKGKLGLGYWDLRVDDGPERRSICAQWQYWPRGWGVRYHPGRPAVYRGVLHHH